jgi:hypothetical protein
VLVGAVVGSSGTEQLAGAVEVGGTSKEEERSGQQEILQDGVGGARWAEAAASQLRVRFCEKQRRLNPPWGGLDELVCSWRVGVGVGGDDLHIFSLSGEHTLTFTRGWWYINTDTHLFPVRFGSQHHRTTTQGRAIEE